MSLADDPHCEWPGNCAPTTVCTSLYIVYFLLNTMYCFLHAVYLCCASCILVFLCAVYLCCMLCIGFAHHVFLAVHSVFHLQRMFCAEYHKHLETTHFRYKSPVDKSLILFELAPSIFSTKKPTRIALAWYCLSKRASGLLFDLFYFVHLTVVWGG